MVGLMVLREPIIRVLFEHGRFGAESTTLTARALLYYSIGLPAFAAIKLIVPAFYSTQDTRTPVRVAVYALGLNVLLNTIFMKSFFQTFYNGGPALATSLSAYFNFLMLFVIFRQRFGRLGTFHILVSMFKIAVCSGVMGVLCYAMLKLSRFETYTHFLPQLLVLVLILVAATAAFIALSWVMRCTEVEEVYGIATRKDERAALPRGPSLGE